MTVYERLCLALSQRYRVTRELGAGGMATVYLAHDLKHERDVAIKVLHPELGAALGADRFLSEIKTTAAAPFAVMAGLYVDISGTALRVPEAYAMADSMARRALALDPQNGRGSYACSLSSRMVCATPPLPCNGTSIPSRQTSC